MHKNSASRSGTFNPRVLVAFALCSFGVLLAMLSFAASPSNELKNSKSNSAAPLGRNTALKTSTPLPSSPTTDWAIVTSPNVVTQDPQTNSLGGVACSSASDCWAVGNYDSGNLVYQTLIERWNGTSWSIVSSPNTNAMQTNSLTGVTCSSASDCWAVGDYQSGAFLQTLIEHWNGTSWSIVPSPNIDAARNVLAGVTCTSTSDCWAVGYSISGDVNQVGVNQMLIERWDGASWSIATSPNTDSTLSNSFSGVSCSSASQCWAVGGHDTAGGPGQTLIARWDGASWAIVPSANTSNLEPNSLSSVTCVSASDCWAVGFYRGGGVWHTLIERWNGTSWAIVSSPNAGTSQHNFLYGLTCTSTSDCWAVGNYRIGPDFALAQTLIERWDGTSWSVITSPSASATQDNFLKSVVCVVGSECWAVGSYYTGTVSQTLIEEHVIPPLKITSVSRSENGPFHITGEGLPNFTITIQASPDLVTPFSNLSETTSDDNGVFQYDDADAATIVPPQRFYRAAYP